MTVHDTIRKAGYCGLVKPMESNRLRTYVCMETVLHDGPHHDSGTHHEWEAELTEEEKAVPMEVHGVGMVNPVTRLPEGAIPMPAVTALMRHHGIEGKVAYRMPDEPTKQRPGDQVLPTGDESLVDDQQLVIDDLEARRQVGIERYGQGHRPFNGRDTLEDLYEEQLDLLVYLRSIKRMGEASKEDVIDVISKELQKNGLQQIVCDAMAEQVYIRIQGWIAANIMKESRA